MTSLHHPTTPWHQQLATTHVPPIIQQHLLPSIRIADFHEDYHQATDLVVVHAADTTINVRIRTRPMYDRYPNDITFRAANRSYHETELDKVFGHGHGDYMFYGFATSDRTNIHAWRIINLNVLRAHHTLAQARNTTIFGSFKDNHDGTGFRPVDITRYPESIHASHGFADPQPALFTAA